MKILILGSSGQIGNSACFFLKKNGYEIIEFDIFRNKNEDLRCHDLSLLESSVSKCDFVYFFAFDVGGAKYLENFEHTYDFITNNMKIMNNVFFVLKKYKKPFIFTSTQMSEMHYSSYGILKKLGESITNDIGGLVVRLWNVYGIEHNENKSHVITDFCNMAKNNGIIKMMTNGQESRQFLFVDDCIECLISLTEKYKDLDKSKNYHITSFCWTKILEIAEYLKEISGCDVIIGKKEDQTQKNLMNPPDPYILNMWKPKTSLKEGILKIYNHL